MQDNISPEERLLRLIRGEHQKPSGQGKQVSGKAQSPARAAKIARQGYRGRFSFNQTNRILLACFLSLSIYLLADFFITGLGKFKERVLAARETNGRAFEIPVQPSEVPPVSYYSQAVRAKDLFGAPSPAVKQAPPSSTFLEMVSKLKLQGIISGTNPQAVIEDTNTRQVHFLSPGESIGEIELKRILPGKVQLDYYGQVAELPL